MDDKLGNNIYLEFIFKYHDKLSDVWFVLYCQGSPDFSKNNQQKRHPPPSLALLVKYITGGEVKCPPPP